MGQNESDFEINEYPKGCECSRRVHTNHIGRIIPNFVGVKFVSIPRNRIIASSFAENTVRIFDSKKCVKCYKHTSSTYDIMYLKDLKQVVFGDDEGSINFLDVSSLRMKRKIKVAKKKSRVTSLIQLSRNKIFCFADEKIKVVTADTNSSWNNPSIRSIGGKVEGGGGNCFHKSISLERTIFLSGGFQDNPPLKIFDYDRNSITTIATEKGSHHISFISSYMTSDKSSERIVTESEGLCSIRSIDGSRLFSVRCAEGLCSMLKESDNQLILGCKSGNFFSWNINEKKASEISSDHSSGYTYTMEWVNTGSMSKKTKSFITSGDGIFLHHITEKEVYFHPIKRMKLLKKTEVDDNSSSSFGFSISDVLVIEYQSIKYILAATAGKITIYSLSTYEYVSYIDNSDGWIRHMYYYKDKNIVIASTDKAKIVVWKIVRKKGYRGKKCLGMERTQSIGIRGRKRGIKHKLGLVGNTLQHSSRLVSVGTLDDFTSSDYLSQLINIVVDRRGSVSAKVFHDIVKLSIGTLCFSKSNDSNIYYGGKEKTGQFQSKPILSKYSIDRNTIVRDGLMPEEDIRGSITNLFSVMNRNGEEILFAGASERMFIFRNDSIVTKFNLFGENITSFSRFFTTDHDSDVILVGGGKSYDGGNVYFVDFSRLSKVEVRRVNTEILSKKKDGLSFRELTTVVHVEEDHRLVTGSMDGFLRIYEIEKQVMPIFEVQDEKKEKKVTMKSISQFPDHTEEGEILTKPKKKSRRKGKTQKKPLIIQPQEEEENEVVFNNARPKKKRRIGRSVGKPQKNKPRKSKSPIREEEEKEEVVSTKPKKKRRIGRSVGNPQKKPSKSKSPIREEEEKEEVVSTKPKKKSRKIGRSGGRKPRKKPQKSQKTVKIGSSGSVSSSGKKTRNLFGEEKIPEFSQLRTTVRRFDPFSLLKGSKTQLDPDMWNKGLGVFFYFPKDKSTKKVLLDFIREHKEERKEFNQKQIQFMIKKHPFASGGERYAYILRIIGIKSFENKMFVAKRFRKDDDNNNNNNTKQKQQQNPTTFVIPRTYLNVVSLSKICGILASFFCKQLERKGVENVIMRYIPSFLLMMETQRKGRVICSLEEGIEGEWESYNDNGGTFADNFFHPLPQAFSHFTYDVSDGYCIVCDIQGVCVSEKEYMLTDPAIHTKDMGMYESDGNMTNLGVVGINSCLKVHQCNEYCKILGLKEIVIETQEEENNIDEELVLDGDYDIDFSEL